MPAILALLLAATLGAAASGFTPEELWQSWPQERFVTTTAPCLRPTELETSLRELTGRHPGGLTLDEAGQHIGVGAATRHLHRFAVCQPLRREHLSAVGHGA